MTTTPEDPATDPRRDDPRRPDETLLLRSPDALVAALPYLLGFSPQESAVLLWLRRGRILLTQRIDLPDPSDDPAPWLGAVWGHTAASSADELILVLVTDRADAAAIAIRVLDEAGARDLLVRDALRVDAGRWWSLLCDDASCCGPQGRPVDAAVAATVAAEFAIIGRAPLADRESLVRGMSADPEGIESVRGRVQVTADLLARMPRRALERWRDHTIGETLSQFDRATRAQDRTSAPQPEEVAMLVAGLRDVRVRDTVLWECARMAGDERMAALSVLMVGLRCAPAGAVAPVATCCALVAWLAGDGARASVAVERALADDPAYSLAQLLVQSLSAGMPPEAWQQATAGLTRSECRHGSAHAGRAPRLAS